MTRTEMLAVMGVYFCNTSNGDLAKSTAMYILRASHDETIDPEHFVVPALDAPRDEFFNRGLGVQIKHLKQYLAGEMDEATTLLFMDRMVDFGQSCLLYEIVTENKLDVSNVETLYQDIEILMTPQRRAVAQALAEGPNLSDVSIADEMLRKLLGGIIGQLGGDEGEAPKDGDIRKAEFTNFVPGTNTRQ